MLHKMTIRKKDDNDQNQSDQVNNSKEEDRNERIEEPQKHE